MAHTKVLIAVKTYPTLSTTHDELVCTAGFREDGSWIRIYPIPFRKLDYSSRYKKYQWVEVDVEKNLSDFRPESYKVVKGKNDKIKILGNPLDTNDSWRARKETVLKVKARTNLAELIKEAKSPKIATSLAVFKPTNIIDFVIEKTERDWDKTKLTALDAKAKQGDLFKEGDNPFKIVKKLPYKFFYKFTDDSGKESKLMIEDWEIGQLYWNCLKKSGNDEKVAIAEVKKKYFDNFAKTKDLHFFLGTTKEHHFVSHNPFIIIGTFHPKPALQASLF